MSDFVGVKSLQTHTHTNWQTLRPQLHVRKQGSRQAGEPAGTPQGSWQLLWKTSAESSTWECQSAFYRAAEHTTAPVNGSK